jgi:hypothetical protein
MNRYKFLPLAAIAGLCFATSAPKAQAQISVEIGVAPQCPYGYYEAAPYGCAPYGYYGPEWFTGGVFIGAGPWFHGPKNFQGHVDNNYHPEHGYTGTMPERGEKPAPEHAAPPANFKGNEVHNGHGPVTTNNEHGQPEKPKL